MVHLVVILPVYNGGHYLKQSVESVLNQSVHDFEFYILDDCSTDGSWEYLSSLKDDRIRLFRNDVNRGLFYNLNFLIKSSGADLIKLWSQDDIMYPQCIEKILAFHKQYPQIGFSYTATHTIDEDGVIQEKSFIDKTPELISPELHARIAFYTGSIAGNIANVTLNRKALNEVGLFREDMKICGDFDMWVRLAKDNPVGFIKEALTQLRNHKKQLSRQEVYYIFHLTEDLQIYRYLLSYVSEAEQKSGKVMLRNFKLMFYYTLMIKTLAKGKLGVTIKFWKALAGFDSMLLLTASFIRNKSFKSVRKDLLLKHNIPLL
jgi:glycosyltransferase involved in cell wall biosynthesis